MAASLVLDDRTGHYPQPRGGRDGMCDGTKLRALCLFLSIEEARLVETDGAARGETELARAIPKYRANKSRVKLAWAMPSAADIQRS